MVAFAATAVSHSLGFRDPVCTDLNSQYWSALEEWQSGHFVPKQFEAEKYTRTYSDIYNYVTDLLEHDPRADDALDCLSSWAGEWYVGHFLLAKLAIYYVR